MNPDVEKEIEEVLRNHSSIGFGWVKNEHSFEGRTLVKTQELTDSIKQLINKVETRARIDELERLDTGRHYGMDYQDSLDEVDTERRNRIAHLKATLVKEEDK